MIDTPSIELAGNYLLRIQLGDNELGVSPGVFTLAITEYLDRLLSDVTLTLKDPTELVTNEFYPNSKNSKLSIMLGAGDEHDNSITDALKFMKFRIYRRFPISITSGVNSLRIVGLSDINKLFSPEIQRGWTKQSIQYILEQIGTELGIKNYDIERGLQTTIVDLVQPHWANIQMLNYLTLYAQSAMKECGFICNVDNPAGLSVTAGGDRLRFRAMSSLLNEKIKATFGFIKTPIQDVKPIFMYEAIDNYETTQILGMDKQRYQYYDYVNGEFIDTEIDIGDVGFANLSKYINYDQITGTEGLHAPEVLRNDGFFKFPDSIAKGRYYKRLNEAVKLWITSSGNTKLSPGDLIMIVPPKDDTNFNKVYTGAWMIERVVHHIEKTYYTKYLLTRPGIDTSLLMQDLKSPSIYKQAQSTLQQVRSFR